MANKTVLITGAGFSAPAKIPIQNTILNEMTNKESPSFLNFDQIRINRKFLHSYIEVGIFLLSEYTNFPSTTIKDEYNQLKKALSERSTIIKIFDLLNSKPDIDKKIVLDVYGNFIISDEVYIKQLILLKEQIRQELGRHTNEIILEDIFTSFDKTNLVKEHGNQYTYQEMDNIRFSIMRLFVYYLGLRTKNHSINHIDYLNTIRFIQKNKDDISIITTNWDTIFEEYLRKFGIGIDFSLNNPYFKFEEQRTRKRKNDSIKFIKIHGSINWCKCLNCGLISIFENKPFGEFLFNDKVVERCEFCKKEAKDLSIQLQPEIITPTMIKSINNQLYSNLWREASFELSKADQIIFIGYSLPHADFEFRYLLKRNIKSNAKIDIVLVKNDDPGKIRTKNKSIKNLLPYKRYEELFSQNKLEFFYEGFGKYFEDINGKT